MHFKTNLKYDKISCHTLLSETKIKYNIVYMAESELLKTLRLGLGEKIKFYRKKKGLTQDKLAEMLNSTPQTLSGIETGRNFPSFTLLSGIIDILNIEPYKLFMFDNNKLDTKSEEFDMVLQKKFQNTTYKQRKLIYSLIDAVMKNY